MTKVDINEEAIPFDSFEDVVQIVLPAHRIPHNSTVTKLHGTNSLVLQRKLKLYMLQDHATEKAMPNLVEVQGIFLVKDGNINQITPDTKLIWHIGLSQLETLMQDLYEGTPQ